jgi:hypothetical protein
MKQEAPPVPDADERARGHLSIGMAVLSLVALYFGRLEIAAILMGFAAVLNARKLLGLITGSAQIAGCLLVLAALLLLLVLGLQWGWDEYSKGSEWPLRIIVTVGVIAIGNALRRGTQATPAQQETPARQADWLASESLPVACPRCKAEPGKPCKTWLGRPRYAHWARDIANRNTSDS